jgi:glycosyltransferase involved in cell wall biosynthesis
MHVVALNWRDLRNPRAGGAEVHMEEILRRLGRRGWRCTLLASAFPGAPAEEQADGYRIVRAGGEYTFHLAVPRLFQRVTARDPADVVVDDVNKIPLLAPLWARVPVVMMVPHLMGTSVFDEVTWPVAAALYAYERLTEPVYRRCPLVEVISQSTKDDLVARGWPPERVRVVLCGVDRGTFHERDRAPKSAAPSLLYVGRLKRYKAVDHLLRALPLVRARVPAATLTIVGSGDEADRLAALARSLGVADAVRFAGFVPVAEKVRLMQSAHVAVNPSVREGWGLTNVEANACGTAVVAADSPGLRDSCLDGRTGLLYPWGDVAALAERVTRVLLDPALRARLEAGGREWAASLTWERCADETAALLAEAAGAPAVTSGSGASTG